MALERILDSARLVIEFKRDVYQMALTELARFLPRGAQHNRYLRSGMRPHHREDGSGDAPSTQRRPGGDRRLALAAHADRQARPRWRRR